MIHGFYRRNIVWCGKLECQDAIGEIERVLSTKQCLFDAFSLIDFFKELSERSLTLLKSL